MKNILIAGGTGLVGRELQNKFKELNWKYSILSTNPNSSSENVYYWNPSKSEIDIKAFDNITHIINLAGAGIADKRWSSKRKKEIIESRVQSTDLLFQTVKRNHIKIESYITASAIGYYGMKTTDKIYKEDDKPADDFLGAVTAQWENAADKFSELNIGTVKFRIGVVLSNKGGALLKMVLPIKFGIGSALGKGNQYMPWIHITDLAEMFAFAVKNSELNGAYNAVAPEHVTNKQFTQIVAKVLHRPLLLPAIPEFLLKAILGEQSGLVLEGSRVSPEKIINSGFKYKFNHLEPALESLLSENSK